MAQAVQETQTGVIRPPHDLSPLTELLAQDPSRITRRFLYAVLFLFLLALVASCILEVDVTVTAPAVLRPAGKALNIQPDIAGTVVELRVQEGQAVQAGEVLAVLESEKAGEQLLALRESALKLQTAQRNLEVILPEAERLAGQEVRNLQEQIQFLQREREHLGIRRRHESEAHKLAEQAYREQLGKLAETDRRLDSALVASKESFAFRQRQVELYDRLQRTQAIGNIEFLAVRRDLADAQAALERLQSQKREVQNDQVIADKNFQKEREEHHKRLAELSELLERNQVQNRSAQLAILRNQKELKLKRLDAETAEQTARAEFELARRRAELSRGEGNRRLIEEVARGQAAISSTLQVLAPVAGRIGTVSLRRQGEAVERGQTLMTLLPREPLVAEIRIANRDVGLVQPGQSVKLKLDAFPHAEYGSLRGVLTGVAPEAEGLDRPEDSFYRSTARLEMGQLRKHGSPVNLLTGMTASAEIVTDRRTVLQLILQPLLEPFRN